MEQGLRNRIARLRATLQSFEGCPMREPLGLFGISWFPSGTSLLPARTKHCFLAKKHDFSQGKQIKSSWGVPAPRTSGSSFAQWWEGSPSVPGFPRGHATGYHLPPLRRVPAPALRRAHLREAQIPKKRSESGFGWTSRPRHRREEVVWGGFQEKRVQKQGSTGSGALGEGLASKSTEAWSALLLSSSGGRGVEVRLAFPRRA